METANRRALPIEPKKIKDKRAVWMEMNEMAMRYKSLSLGIGTPGYPPPKFLRDFMMESIDSGFNQYCRSLGTADIVQNIAKVYGPKLNRELDPMKEIVVTNGANGALNVSINAFVNEGDELIAFEPCFPSYFDHC